MIDWLSFALVAVAAIVGACVVVSLYALGIRLLALADRILYVEPAEFPDAITVVSANRAARHEAKAARARAHNPLTPGRRRAAVAGGYICFALCALVVLFGIYLIVPALH